MVFIGWMYWVLVESCWVWIGSRWLWWGWKWLFGFLLGLICMNWWLGSCWLVVNCLDSWWELYCCLVCLGSLLWVLWGRLVVVWFWWMFRWLGICWLWFWSGLVVGLLVVWLSWICVFLFIGVWLVWELGIGRVRDGRWRRRLGWFGCVCRSCLGRRWICLLGLGRLWWIYRLVVWWNNLLVCVWRLLVVVLCFCFLG